MARKFLFLVGLGAGYVLGTRAGREQYDKLVAQANKVWESPRVARARRDVEAYARQQAPIIAERAEAAAKAAPGVIADGARKTADAAKDVADRTTVIAKDVAGRTSVVAKDVAGRTTVIARDVADKTTTTVKDAADKTATTVKDVTEKVGETISDALSDTIGTVRGKGTARTTDISLEAPDATGAPKAD
jgi:hypothetical protein